MRQYRISTTMLWWLVLAQSMAILPHITRVPIWLYGLFIFCAFRRIMVAYTFWSLPKYWFVFSVALMGLASILISGIEILSIEAANALLVLAFSLKLLELKALRDSNLIIFLGFFLVLSNLLHSQSILMLIYLFASILLYTVVFIGLNRQGDVSPLPQVLGRALSLLLQAVPLTLFLLFLFPRPDWPFLSFAQDAMKAKTGFSDQLTPGLISEVAESNDLVFRAKFLSHQAPTEALYWRGWTFDTYDGYRWTRAGINTGVYPSLENAKAATHYAVWMQETLYRQLFTLGLPAHHLEGFYLTDDYLLQSHRLVPAYSPFVVSSYHQDSFLVPISPQEESYFTHIPNGLNPQSLGIVKDIKNNNQTNHDKIRALERFFSSGELKYHLKVQKLTGNNRIDDFLFRTKVGYCEHFATSYAYLARAMGIPARVVAGFLGGEYREDTNEWLVRKRHAHTWVEVWLSDEGWKRVDPTAFVAPWRIKEFEHYYRSMLEESGIKGWVASHLLEMREVPLLNRWIAGLEQMNQHWMSSMHTDFSGFSHQWRQRLISFSQILNYSHYFLFVFFTLSLSIILGLVTRKPKTAISSFEHLHQKFIRLLKKGGVIEKSVEGPSDYIQRACQQLPQHQALIMDVHQRFMMIKFGAPMDKLIEKEIIKGLSDKVKSFEKALLSP